jgi:sugar lactone lactonase YvrE
VRSEVAALKPELLVDVRCDLGEGPMWHPERAVVTWVEIYEGRVNSVGIDGTPGTPVEVGRRVGAAVPAEGGGLLLATDEGFATLSAAGDYTLVAAVEAGRDDTFMNDGKCDPAGRFWAGTVAVDPETQLAVDGGGSLYVLSPDGSVDTALTGVSLSNGMDWSPDGRVFYYIDSRTGRVDEYRYDLSTGEIGEPRGVVAIDPELGFADGMCVDADGYLWIAIWGCGQVRRYSPGGELDLAIDFPVSQVTSCAFAGPDLDVLVVTSARRHLDEARARDEPRAGSVFCLRTGHRGLPPTLWRCAK